MDTYAHTQDKPRLELTEKIEANFYSQDLTPAAPQPCLLYTSQILQLPDLRPQDAESAEKP